MEETNIWIHLVNRLNIGKTSRDKAILAFGLSKLVYLTLNTIFVVIAGLLTNNISNCIGYFVSFVFLRKNAGGYHAHSKRACLLITCILEACAVAFICSIHFTLYSFVSEIVIALIIYMLAPIESVNKSLSLYEQTVYKKHTLYVIIICLFVSLIDFIMRTDFMMSGIYIAFIEVLLMMLPSKVSNPITGSGES